MKNIIKAVGYSAVALSSVAYSTVSATIDPGLNKITKEIGTSEVALENSIENLLTFFLGFLGLIAVILLIYAGFSIMTAG
jgi:hypothetical protein